MSKNKLVYIASPYAGDIANNIRFAQDACRYAITEGHTPIAVHLHYPQFLDDHIPEERYAGLEMGYKMLSVCDELWVCGDVISNGMRAEIQKAKEWGIPIRGISREQIVEQHAVREAQSMR